MMISDNADIENDGPATRSRKRRSSGALTDISNMGSSFLQQSISYMGKKFGTSKKRKTSDENCPPTEVVVSNNPIADKNSSESLNCNSTDSNDLGTSKHNVEASKPQEDLNDSFASFSSSTCEIARYGFEYPSSFRRKLPLVVRGSNPCECLDIYDGLYAFFVEDESKFITKSYFNLQTEMTPRIRAVLVDWIIEIHYKYKMQPLTLWMIINVLDRYLSKSFLPRNRLQLAAIVSLLICCKFEEVHTPEVRDCIYLTDNAYSRTDVLQAETAILAAIDYDLMVPTPYHFFLRFFRRLKASDRFRAICNYIAERNLMECEILDMSPRLYASAAVLAANYTLYHSFGETSVPEEQLWTDALEEEADYAFYEVYPHAKQMLATMNVPLQPSTRRKVEAALKKYSSLGNCNVAQMTFPTI